MKIVIRDPQRCLACHSCELACAVAHSQKQELLAAVISGETPVKRIFVESIGKRAVPLTCRHCLKAPCLEACPVEALERDPRTGAVVPIPEKCIGCHACIEACPFGVIQVVSGQVVKCDLCQGNPACVAACPTGALRLMAPEELSAERRGLTARAIFRLRRRDERKRTEL